MTKEARLESTDADSLRSPLADLAAARGAHLGREAGWLLAEAFGEPDAAAATARAAAVMVDVSARGKIRIEGDGAGALLEAAALPVGAGMAASLGWIYRLRPDLFFVSCPADGVAAAVAALASAVSRAPDLVTVTDMTHGQAQIRLVGPHSAILLGRLCGLDFSAGRFPNGAARQSSVAKTAQLILRRDLAGVRAYDLVGGRSLAAYLWETILAAGADLGLQPAGYAVLERLRAEAAIGPA